MEKLFEEIYRCLSYFKRYCKNAYIKNQCRIIGIKLEEIENRKFHNIDTIRSIVDNIVNEIDYKMKKVPDLSDKMYDAMDELKSYVIQIPDNY